jgi:sulfite exporter TauE/SafE
MKAIFNKIFSLIGMSVYDKKDGKVSSTRMSSYFILGAILTAAGVFIGIDIVNAIVALYNKGFYEVPANHIVLYGMTLAHHLTLLGINKNAEQKVEMAVQDKLKSINQLKSKEVPSKPVDEEEV